MTASPRNTMISTHATEQEAVDRQTQYGVRFPDGSVLWATTGTIDAYGKVNEPIFEYNGKSVWPSPKHDTRRNQGSFLTFRGLVEEHAAQCARLGVPVSNLVRIKREVVVVYGVATDDKTGGEFDV